MRLLNDNLMEVKRSLKEITEKMSMLEEEISRFASKNDFITLQRYVEFWEPVDFVTRKEVNGFLRKRFGTTKTSAKPIEQHTTTTRKADSQQVTPEDAYPDTD